MLKQKVSACEKDEPQIENELTFELPEKCGCGFDNLKMFGNRLNGRVTVDVRCMRCGKILYEKK